MSKRILWIDNDRIFLAPHVLRLETEGFQVDKVITLTEGLEAIERINYDLLILDVMLPVKEEEEKFIPAVETDFGKKTGLVFYKRYKQILKEKGISVFVFTVREDAEISSEFLDAHLPVENFMTKSQGKDTDIFFERVRKILGQGEGHGYVN